MVDFEKYRTVSMQEILKTGGNAQGGLTVRDYFAAKVMSALIGRWNDESFSPELISHIAMASYETADAMMEERNKPVHQPTPSVEEAFGFTQPVPVEGGLSVKSQLYGEDK